MVSSGALATLSGTKTGRSPRDKRIVREPDSEADIWWRQGDNGSPNYDMDERLVRTSSAGLTGPSSSLPLLWLYMYCCNRDGVGL